MGYSVTGYSVCSMNVGINKACGKCLAKMRRAAGLTQVELARKMGVPQSFVSKVETGQRSLKLYEQFAYANAMNIDIHKFVDEIEKTIRTEK